MPKYDNDRDWVELAGVAQLPMRQLLTLEAEDIRAAHAFVVSVTVDAHFKDASGELVDWKNDVLGLTVQQWNWWKSRVWAAARDEKLDPEV